MVGGAAGGAVKAGTMDADWFQVAEELRAAIRSVVLSPEPFVVRDPGMSLAAWGLPNRACLFICGLVLCLARWIGVVL